MMALPSPAVSMRLLHRLVRERPDQSGQLRQLRRGRFPRKARTSFFVYGVHSSTVWYRHFAVFFLR